MDVYDLVIEKNFQTEKLIKKFFAEKDVLIKYEHLFVIVEYSDILPALINKVLNTELELTWNYLPDRTFRDYICILSKQIKIFELLKELNISVIDLEQYYRYKYVPKEVDVEIKLTKNSKFISLYSTDYHFQHGKYLYVYTATSVLYTINVSLDRNLNVTNLQIPDDEQVYVGYQGKIDLKIKEHNHFKYSFKQRLLFLRKNIQKMQLTNSNEKIMYKETGSTKPKKLIILNPYMQVAHSDTPLTIMEFKKLQTNVENCRFISLIDEWQTYMLYNGSGEFIFEDYVEFVKVQMNKYQLTEKDLIFIGFSKGGTICLNFHKYFLNSYYVVGTPQLNVISFAMKHSYLMNYISQTQFSRTIDYLYHLHTIEDFVKLPNTMCFFAKGDTLSNDTYHPAKSLIVDEIHEKAAQKMESKIIEFVQQIVKGER
ncbi:MAG: hypothetical protein ACRCUP_03305 [Mycoplasmatales bacterium]